MEAKTRATTWLAIVLGWSWLLWGAAALFGSEPDVTRSPIFLAGGAGPFLAAVALTHWRESRAVQRDFWLRIVDPRRMPAPWLAVALLLHPAIVALAFAVDGLLGGSAPVPDPRVDSPSQLLPLLFFVFWFGPLPEEIGWRGFALDRLQTRMSALWASLALGSVWALWHVPLFFVPGSFQSGLGFGSERFWIFSLALLPLSVLMTWVYNHSRRSTLSAVLIHYSGNVCGALLPKSERVAALELALLGLAALAVVLVWGPERLTGRGSGSGPDRSR